MTSVTAFHVADASALAELSRVMLRVEQRARDGRRVPAGSSGIVVEVLAQGQAYIIEFGRPFHALITVEASDVAAAAEA